ncbi:MAG: hypothetical protein R3227_13445 [Reinekea sp.]|nr:hypothetical protein [Reinekea sp.]
MTKYELAQEDYAQLLDVLARISHDISLGASALNAVAVHPEISFIRRAMSNSIGEIMKAVWEIEDRFPELKDYSTKRKNDC